MFSFQNLCASSHPLLVPDICLYLYKNNYTQFSVDLVEHAVYEHFNLLSQLPWQIQNLWQWLWCISVASLWLIEMLQCHTCRVFHVAGCAGKPFHDVGNQYHFAADATSVGTTLDDATTKTLIVSSPLVLVTQTIDNTLQGRMMMSNLQWHCPCWLVACLLGPMTDLLCAKMTHAGLNVKPRICACTRGGYYNSHTHPRGSVWGVLLPAIDVASRGGHIQNIRYLFCTLKCRYTRLLYTWKTGWLFKFSWMSMLAFTIRQALTSVHKVWQVFKKASSVICAIHCRWTRSTPKT